MKKYYKIKRSYNNAACDIFQIPEIPNSILNEKQVTQLVNLNVLSKWTDIKVEHGIKANDYVICVDEPQWEMECSEDDPRGSGWEEGLVFRVENCDVFDILWGGKNGWGVYANYTRKATQKEINKATEEGTILNN